MAKAKTKIKYFLYNNRVYQEEIVDNLFVRGKQVDIPQQNSAFQWRGSLIPMDLHRQIISFFIEGYKKIDSENLIWLYYDIDTGEWLAWAPPQTGQGMTVEADEKSKAFKEQRSQIEERFVQLGTYHHHCSGNASQSGTDKNDECDREGIHITVGKLGQIKTCLDFHARATFRGENYSTHICDWIAQPEWIQHVPESLRRQFAYAQLAHPEKDAEFPEFWLDNVKKKQYRSSEYHQGHHTFRQQNFKEWDPPITKRAMPNTGIWYTEADTTTDSKILLEIEKIVDKTFEEINQSKEDFYTVSYNDKKRIALIVSILLEQGMDAEEAEDYILAEEYTMTGAEASLQKLLFDEMSKNHISPGYLKYLFNHYPIRECFDNVLDVFAMEELEEASNG